VAEGHRAGDERHDGVGGADHRAAKDNGGGPFRAAGDAAVDALALTTQQAEDSSGWASAGPNCGSRVSNVATSPGPRPHVVIGQDQPHLPGQNVEPFVALVGAPFELIDLLAG
jgi:hypothetical protein